MALRTQKDQNRRPSFGPTRPVGQTQGGGRAPGDEQPNLNREEIAKLAYDLYRKRGGTHGNDWGDWFQAEAILKRNFSSLE